MYRLEMKFKMRYTGFTSNFAFGAPDYILDPTDEQSDMLGWLDDNLGYPHQDYLTIPLIAKKWRIEQGYGNLFWMDGKGPLAATDIIDISWYGYWLEVDEESAVQLKLMYPTLFHRIIQKPEQA